MKSRTHFGASLLILAVVSQGYYSLAQSVSTVYSFAGQNSSGFPNYVTLTQGRDGNLYGTTFGSSKTTGTVFKMKITGATAHVSTIYTFGSDGSNPLGGLTLATDGNFYGTTFYGGASNVGVLFKLSPRGTYTVLHEFVGGSDGASPVAPPVEASDGNLYGATMGTGFASTVYKYTINGGTYSTIYDFSSANGEAVQGPLIEGSNGHLYGAAFLGGLNGFCGTLFELTKTGSLVWSYEFPCGSGGQSPWALTQTDSGTFYGATFEGGGQLNCGSIFEVGPTGNVSILYAVQSYADGCNPETALTSGTDGNLYGIIPFSGKHDGGTLFRVTQSGDFDLLNSFGASGNTPLAAPMQDTNGIFYGTTSSGGKYNSGTIYSYNAGLAPFVTFVLSVGKVGQSAQILGQGFTGTTSVTFNGVPATSFKVVSDTYMTAVVPADATTGPVVVTTPGGKLTSNVSFRISK